MLAYLARRIDRPRSIYSKTVKGMTRKDLQLDQLRRHSIRNYLVTDNIVHPCNWPDRLTANEKKKEKSYHAPFYVPVTAVLTAMRKQFISELYRMLVYLLFMSYINLLFQTMKYLKINN